MIESNKQQSPLLYQPQIAHLLHEPSPKKRRPTALLCPKMSIHQRLQSKKLKAPKAGLHSLVTLPVERGSLRHILTCNAHKRLYVHPILWTQDVLLALRCALVPMGSQHDHHGPPNQSAPGEAATEWTLTNTSPDIRYLLEFIASADKADMPKDGGMRDLFPKMVELAQNRSRFRTVESR